MFIKDGLNLLYPTPFYKTTMSQELCQDMVDWYMTTDGVHADIHDEYELVRNNIFLRNDDIINTFKECVTEKFEEFFKNALDDDMSQYERYYVGWINRSTGYGSMPTHNHSGSHFVSVFYLYSDPKDTGNIVLQDPRFNANRGYLPNHQKHFANIELTPKTGDVIIFPAYLYHYVKPSNSNLRIACPVDVYIKDKVWFNNIEKSLKGNYDSN
jgi:hypothetical protein